MRIPVVLTTVRAQVDPEGRVVVEVDGAPYATDRDLTRRDVRDLLQEITTDLGTAVRIEIREADGTTYTDIATPPVESEPSTPAPQDTPTTTSPVLAVSGFAPGEEVALAYVVHRLTADDSGHADINLPPALLTASRNGLVLLGLTSRTIAPIEATP